MNNIPDDPRLKDIESDPRGNKIRTGIEKETGTKIKDFKTDKFYPLRVRFPRIVKISSTIY